MLEAIAAITGVVAAITGVLTLLLEWKKYKDKPEERQGRIIPPPSPRPRQSSSLLSFISGLLFWVIWLCLWFVMVGMISIILAGGLNLGSDFYYKFFPVVYFISAYPVGRYFQKEFHQNNHW